MPKRINVKKVLVLGSGAIKIGEAGEFDYSGTQCLKALKDEGIETVLINPNIATIQTDKRFANKIYFLPVTFEYAKEVIEKERPDGILLTFGGQTALNCGVLLYDNGILDKYSVKVLGTSVESIKIASDRKLFKEFMIKNNIPVPKSKFAYNLDEAKEAAKEIGYPVMVRVAYTLGGKGSGIAYNENELTEIVERGLAQSLIGEVLIEEYLGELKQIEYEVMRDFDNNSITVCNMENILGMRVHTGDNIVVAPSQTLNNYEYHILRKTSIDVASVLNIIGECNVQFALDSRTCKYYVIETNPRMSRSSALASKATGYPLAYIATKLALNYKLYEIINSITKVTTTSFEPSLDYIVVKIPRWDFDKFPRVNRNLRTQMKSVGEVMAIGRNFEEALQKAIRMLDIGYDGLYEEVNEDIDTIKNNLININDKILFYIVKAIKKGISLEEISKLSKIDLWYIYKIKNIVDIENELKSINFDENNKEHIEIIKKAKKFGFSDSQISKFLNLNEDYIRKLRKREKIIPVVKQIDTLAAEWSAKTNYLYLTYNGNEDDIEFTNKSKVIILGSGPYRIGSSVEFDWCTVNTIFSLKEKGIEETIVINCNPETVSTDYDISDKLYFEELTLERVLDIYEKENPIGIVVSVGGQIANNLALELERNGVNIIGTKGKDIENAENRSKFSEILDKLNIKQPKWKKLSNIEEIIDFIREIGFPVIVRPSYVLSGTSMKVLWNFKQLKDYLSSLNQLNKNYSLTISKFILNAKEFDVDGVSDGKNVFIGAIIEHIENAGIHSGDAIMVIPPISLKEENKQKIIEYTYKICRALNVKGPFNIQYLVKENDVYVIECNLRSSRSFPYVSKTTGVNLIELCSNVFLNNKLELDGLLEFKGYFSVKAPYFSFMQLDEADPILDVEMRSTGEVACFGETFFEALIKALEASNYRIRELKGNVLISVGGMFYKEKILDLAKKLSMLGFTIFATEHTAEFLIKNGIKNVITVFKVKEHNRKPNIIELLKERKLDFIISIPFSLSLEKYYEMLEDEYVIRRKATELGIPVIVSLETASIIINGIYWLKQNKIILIK